MTLARTMGMAIVAGGVVALSSGNPHRWPAMSLLMLWPTLGGHWVELVFLNRLRPHLPGRASIYRAARVAVWFVGGIVLAAGVRLTTQALFGGPQLLWLTWAVAGAIFVAAELIAHAGLHLRGRPSFFDALG